MPDDFASMFGRMNLQQLRSFLLFGSECTATECGGYQERLEAADQVASVYFHRVFPDDAQFDDAMQQLKKTLAVYQNVYFESGLQLGAQLAHILLGDILPGGAELDVMTSPVRTGETAVQKG